MKLAGKIILGLGLVVGSAQVSEAAVCWNAPTLAGGARHGDAVAGPVDGACSQDRITGHREVGRTTVSHRYDGKLASRVLSETVKAPGWIASGPNPSEPALSLVRGEHHDWRGHRGRKGHRFHDWHRRGHPHLNRRWRGHWSGPPWHRKPHRRRHAGIFWHWHGWRGWHWHHRFVYERRHPHVRGHRH